MFGKKNNDASFSIVIDNNVHYVTFDVLQYIRKLEDTIHDHSSELAAIKPILKTPGLRPAISKHCKECKFVVYNPHRRTYMSPEIIGCAKDVVCDDFVTNIDAESES